MRCLILFLLVFLSAFAAAADDRGRELFAASGCRGCHQLRGDGGKLAPPLDRVGRRLSREQIRQQLSNPRALQNTGPMPAYDHLSPVELDVLADFLAKEK